MHQLLVSASELEICHVFAAVDASYTIAQWLARLPGKQKVPGSNPEWCALTIFLLGLQREFSEVEKEKPDT